MTPFQNDGNFFDSTRSLIDGRLSAIIDAIIDASKRSKQMNELDYFSSDLQVLNLPVYVHGRAT